MDCERDRSFDFPLIERDLLIESDADPLWLIDAFLLRCEMETDLLMLPDIERLCDFDWLSEAFLLMLETLSDFESDFSMLRLRL